MTDTIHRGKVTHLACVIETRAAMMEGTVRGPVWTDDQVGRTLIHLYDLALEAGMDAHGDWINETAEAMADTRSGMGPEDVARDLRHVATDLRVNVLGEDPR